MAIHHLVKKSSLAIEFINKSFEYSDIVCFVLPIQFRKWSAQSKIRNDAILICDETIGDNAFNFDGKPYNVRCCFQIWVKGDKFKNFENIRISEKPKTNHDEFKMYQYNRTEEAKKFFDYEWDFAVPRQGYNDYTFKAYSKEECDLKKQWIFFKASNEEVLRKLLNIDYKKLSLKNTGIPGFGKADVIKEYEKVLDTSLW